MTMMTIKVLLFAELAQRVGARELSLELGEGATVAVAMDELSARYPAIAHARPSLEVAVDASYAQPTCVIRAGQVMALIGPVSGG